MSAASDGHLARPRRGARPPRQALPVHDPAADDGGDDVEAARRAVDEGEVAAAAGAEVAAGRVPDQARGGRGRGGDGVGERAARGRDEHVEAARPGRRPSPRACRRRAGPSRRRRRRPGRRGGWSRRAGRGPRWCRRRTRNRSGPSARQSATSVAGCRWCPSAMTPATRSPASADPSGAGLAGGQGRHGVAEVREAGGAGRHRRLDLGERGGGVPERHDDAAADQAGDDVERAGELRGEGGHQHAGVARPRRDQAVRRRGAASAAGWAPRRDGAISGPSKCRPSGHAPAQPAGGPDRRTASARSRARGRR